MDSNIKEVFESIEYYNEYFPESSVKELLSKENESRDFLIKYMEEFKKNIFKHLNEDDYIGHIFAVIILANFKEKRLCSLFLELLRLPGTRIYELFDTIIPEYGARIIASVFDGNINNIVDVLNDKKANEHAKAVALQSLKILCINGKLDKSDVENFLIELLEGKLKDKSQTLLLEILYTAFELGMNRVLDVLKRGCKNGEYKWALSIGEVEAEIKLYEDGMYINAGLNDLHNQEIINPINELRDIFKIIEEKNNIKSETKRFQDTIIEEINILNKKFKRGIPSVNLKTQLKSLSKKELLEIGKNLGLKGYYKLKKDDLINLIYDNYEEVVKDKLGAFGEHRIKELMSFIKGNGIRKVEMSNQFRTFFYFEEYGLVFPFASKDITAFIMPDMVMNIVKDVISGFTFRRKAKINSEIVILVRGMMEAYGIMSIEEIIYRLRMYGIEETEEQFKKVIREGSGMYYSILDKGYILNANIGDYSIIEEIEKTKYRYDYKFFTKDEIESMGKGEWADNVEYAEKFYNRFVEEFIVERENIINILNDMKIDVQVVSADVITQFMVDSVDNKCSNQVEVEELKESKKIVKSLVKEFLENVPLWKYKGRNSKEIKLEERKG